MSTYRVRGYTGRNTDFDFTVTTDATLQGENLRDIVLENFRHECDWQRELSRCDVYHLCKDRERADLRDIDSQRVYLFDGENCIAHENDDECNEEPTECDVELFMITVDVEEE